MPRLYVGRRGMRGLGQPSSPLPLAPGGFCPSLPTPCPAGTVNSIDANNCGNYPCVSTATTTATPSLESSISSAITSSVTVGNISIPLWGIAAAVVVGGVLLMGGKK